MNSANKILYEHLKDYPTSTEGYNEINNRAVAAALCCEHMPELREASPEKRRQTVIRPWPASIETSRRAALSAV
jgi:hypothetical protein